MENNNSLNLRSLEPGNFPTNEVVQVLLQSGIMPTVQLNSAHQQDNTMQHFQQISSLDAHCRDSFAEQKAKVQQLSETVTRHEAKLDSLLQDTAVLKASADQHLAQKSDVLKLEIDLSKKFDTKFSELNSKVDSHFKWLIGGFLSTAVVICGAMYAFLLKTESDLRTSIEINKTEIVEVSKEMRNNHEDVSKQLAEIRQMLQEKQSTTSIK